MIPIKTQKMFRKAEIKGLIKGEIQCNDTGDVKKARAFANIRVAETLYIIPSI